MVHCLFWEKRPTTRSIPGQVHPTARSEGFQCATVNLPASLVRDFGAVHSPLWEKCQIHCPFWEKRPTTRRIPGQVHPTARSERFQRATVNPPVPLFETLVLFTARFGKKCRGSLLILGKRANHPKNPRPGSPHSKKLTLRRKYPSTYSRLTETPRYRASSKVGTRMPPVPIASISYWSTPHPVT